MGLYRASGGRSDVSWSTYTGCGDVDLSAHPNYQNLELFKTLFPVLDATGWNYDDDRPTMIYNYNQATAVLTVRKKISGYDSNTYATVTAYAMDI